MKRSYKDSVQLSADNLKYGTITKHGESSFAQSGTSINAKSHASRTHNSGIESPDRERKKARRDTNHVNCSTKSESASRTSPVIQHLKSFVTWPLDRFDQPFPFFRQPTEIGHFSQDSRRGFHHNNSQLKIYVPPPNVNNVNFDLRNGYKGFIQRDESIKEYLDQLLQWIQLNKKKFSISGNAHDSARSKCLNTDFVCWRGLLTKLLCTPYENREPWIIAACRHEDTIFLCDFDTEQKLKYRARMTDREKEMTYWGYKFEQYVTAEPGNKPNTTQPVNNHEGFCSVVRSRLKEHSLVYGGEVDCCEPGEEKNPVTKYIELKTSREIETDRQNSNFKKFKLIKWWAQSFLIGIPKIICGFRDDGGTVHRLETFHTVDIPKYCQDIHSPWNASVCFNFLDEFLHHVKRIVSTNDPRVVYLFKWEPRHDIQCEKLPRDSEFCFLPSWFTSSGS